MAGLFARKPLDRLLAEGQEVLGRVGDAAESPRPGRPAPPSGARALIRIPREYHALRARDIYLVTGCAGTGALFLACGTLFSDLALGVVDPRASERLQEAA